MLAATIIPAMLWLVWRMPEAQRFRRQDGEPRRRAQERAPILRAGPEADRSRGRVEPRPEPVIDHREGQDVAFERDSTRKAVAEMLKKNLDETERNVFTLHYGDDLPLDAITRLLNLQNASGAKAYIVSAKRKLARFVHQQNALGRRAV